MDEKTSRSNSGKSRVVVVAVDTDVVEVKFRRRGEGSRNITAWGYQKRWYLVPRTRFDK